MLKLLTAEHLKLKSTFGRKLPVVAPMITLLLALVLTGGGMDKGFPPGAWNWWYIMLLPGMLAVHCYLCMKKDKKIKFGNILALPLSPRKSWSGKILYCSLGLIVSNFIIFLGTTIGGNLFGTSISLQEGFYGALLLSAAYLWEVPVFLFLSAKFGMFASIFTSMLMAVSGTAVLADTSLWWCYPPSIPIRLMCPVLGILPNGLPIPLGSSLSRADIILPGVILSFLWFIGVTFATALWFQRREAKE